MQGRSRAGWNDGADDALEAADETAKQAIGDWGDGFFSAMRAFRTARLDPTGATARARHAETIAASKGNAILSVDVMHLLGIHHARMGDFTRGVDLARRALTMADAWQLPRSRDGARNSLAQLELLSPQGDPLPAVRDAVTVAVRERLRYDLWPTIRTLARWLADHGHAELATVILGHLDAHGLAPPAGRFFDALRSAPGAARLLDMGARHDRDELAAYILQHLPTEA